LDSLEGFETGSERSLFIALLLLLKLSESIHLEVVVALEELSDEALEVLKIAIRF
jgi:hypothetical protein